MTYKRLNCRVCGRDLGVVAHTTYFCAECAAQRVRISHNESKRRMKDKRQLEERWKYVKEHPMLTMKERQELNSM